MIIADDAHHITVVIMMMKMTRVLHNNKKEEKNINRIKTHNLSASLTWFIQTEEWSTKQYNMTYLEKSKNFWYTMQCHVYDSSSLFYSRSREEYSFTSKYLLDSLFYEQFYSLVCVCVQVVRAQSSWLSGWSSLLPSTTTVWQQTISGRWVK